MKTFLWNNYTRVFFPMANRELHNNGTARLSISLRVTSAMPELPMLAKGPNIHEHFPMGLALLAFNVELRSRAVAFKCRIRRFAYFFSQTILRALAALW